MKAYVLTEAQMHAYWALERRAGRPDVSARVADELQSVSDANDAADELPVEGVNRVAGERLGHPERGWTAEHDAGHEGELIRAALSYISVAADLRTKGHTNLDAVGAGFPWASHYFRPRTTAVGNLDKSAALLIAAADAIEAS